MICRLQATFISAVHPSQVTHNPPLISVSVSANPGAASGLKDTAANIKATKEFTVNIISEAFAENANVTSLDAPTEVSEWPISGLTKVESVSVYSLLCVDELCVC